MTGVLNSNIAVACQKLADYLAFGWFPKQQHSNNVKISSIAVLFNPGNSTI
ncbi:MAG: hypothetical protein GXZ09_02845 [Syntrophomonadaceae bacterium]|nr:hypothetical protein [Syntrophomonadaceae bacterium]